TRRFKFLFSEVFDLKPTRMHCIPRVSARRLRLVPKGHWTLARRGGFASKIESEPRPGLRKSRDDHSVAPAGARRISWSEPVVCSRRGDLISATPLASVIEIAADIGAALRALANAKIH